MTTSTDLRAAIEEVRQLLPEDQSGEGFGEAGGTDWTSRVEQRVGALPWWVVSAVVHAVLFLLVTLITVAVPEPPTDEVIITTDVARKKPPEYDEKLKRDIFKNPQEVVAEQKVDQPVVVHEQAEVTDHFETENDMDSQSVAGNEDAISDIPLGGTGVTGSMGVGGGGMAGVFGYRGGGGRKKAIARFGGSPATESAVDAALRWLARHQEADGHWAGDKWGGTQKSYGLSMTGLATLAFLGAGHTHKTGQFRDNVDRAVKYIVSRQRDDGCLFEGGWACQGYSHAMASIALVEAYGMTRDPEFREAAQKSVDYSINIHQKPYSGWRYRPGEEGDTSHTGWFIMHLKSAKIAGLNVDGAAFQGGMNFINKTLSQKSGRSVYQISQANQAFKDGLGGPGHPDRLTAISMVCRLFMGVDRNDEVMKLSARYPEAAPPTWDRKDFYYWYYGTLASFQMGGDCWKKWNEGIKPSLVNNQRKGGPLDGSVNDVDGSWDFDKDPYAEKCGRVYSTALGALCLEVYYRYLPIYAQ